MPIPTRATSPARLVAAWSRRRAAARLTARLQARPDRLLDDIGLARGDIGAAVLRAYPAPSGREPAAAARRGWTLQPG